ncbi:MAG TPA: transcription elongation factor GreA [Myxococcota bacterium]|nr:transcription elongation factor GreA [Myxococcota bacterium]
MASVRLTKKGYTRLKSEFDFLSQKERPKIVQGVATAAAEGDRSENAEYIYGKKKLREIDKRLQYLSRLLKNPEIIDTKMVNCDRVNFGTRVTVLDDDGNQKTWTIVGESEADYKENTISAMAPVALALLGKQIGDVVEVERKIGPASYEILDIAVGEID